LNSLHQRIISTKFNLFWPAGSGEDFKKFSVYFYSFAIISPWRGGYPLPLKTLESSPSKDDLCKVWLKLAQRFWRKRFLNDPIPFYIFVLISPLKRTWLFI
jgi:hypothetical protein